jgi:hypothetical protein
MTPPLTRTQRAEISQHISSLGHNFFDSRYVCSTTYLKVILGYLLFLKLQRENRSSRWHRLIPIDEFFLDALQAQLNSKEELSPRQAYIRGSLTQKILRVPLIKIVSKKENEEETVQLSKDGEKLLNYLLKLFSANKHATFSKMLLLNDEDVFICAAYMAKELSTMGHVKQHLHTVGL